MNANETIELLTLESFRTETQYWLECSIRIVENLSKGKSSRHGEFVTMHERLKDALMVMEKAFEPLDDLIKQAKQ